MLLDGDTERDTLLMAEKVTERQNACAERDMSGSETGRDIGMREATNGPGQTRIRQMTSIQ